jgi:Pyridoxamine 5'-phosphate oxidase
VGRWIGDRLPRDVVRRLQSADQVVAVVATAGERGPDAAPVSLVAVASDRRVLLGLAHDRATLAHIRGGSRVAVCLCLEPDLALTVEGEARVLVDSLPAAAHVAAVDVTVDGVKDDRHPAVHLLGTTRFRWATAEAAATDAALLADLRRLARDPGSG